MSDGRGLIMIVFTNDFDVCTKERAQIPGTIEGNERLKDRVRSVLDIRVHEDVDWDSRGKLAGRITSDLGT